MHELAITDGVVQLVRERLGDQRVARVRLEIGRLTAVEPEAMRFCFDVCTRGTSLDGAALEIDEVAARVRCARCGGEREVPDGIPICACGSADVEIVAGNELRIKEVEVT